MRHVVWLLTLCTVAATQAAETIPIANDGQSHYRIVIAPDADVVTHTAANELQTHLLQVTHAKLPISSEALDSGHRFLVGPSPAVKKLLPGLNVADLEHDGIVIKTVGSDIVLIGRPPRGTLYAVYTFLEDIIGCRWWTSSESFLPEKASLVIPELDVTYAPKLRYREAYYRDALEGVFAARSKCNGNSDRIAPEYGGHYQFAGFVHTFFPLLPPSKYFDAHPEWYSEINGKRSAERTQLCLTNEAMRKELTRNALIRLRNTPGAGLISISQNDWHGRCQCANCLAVEKEEGTASGPLLRFVNAVATDIEKEFPDVLVETLAYQYTRQPPRLVKPRSNVIIRLCSIECSFVQPLVTGPQNEAFRNDIVGWSKIAPQIFVWDYVTNFSNYIVPHPNLRVLASNIRFFADHKTVGLFEQGDSQCGIGDFVRMRAWVLSHLMWNPELNENALIDEFLAGYYGPAAPHLRKYLALIHDAADESGVYLRCFMSDTSAWLDLDTLNQAMQFWKQAEDAVKNDPVLAQRVRRERLPLDHVWLKRYPALKRAATLAGKPFLGPKDPMAACEEFIRLAHEFNVGNYRERMSFKGYEDSLRSRFRPTGPPPELCKGLDAADWIDFPDCQFRLARPGEWTSVVDDPAASDGKAARMPGSHFEWATSYPLSEDLTLGNPWHCYIVARCEAKAKNGLAMTMGIYDTRTKKSVAHRRIELPDGASKQYQVFDLGTHDLHGGMYFWVAPPKRPDEVTAVFVDRMFLIRAKKRP